MPAPTPLAIFGSDLVAWWDATDAASVTQSGGLASAVADKSGHGYTLTSSGTNRPAYSATGYQGQIGALVCDGVNDVMSAADIALATSAYTVFMLAEMDRRDALNPNIRLASYKADADADDANANSAIPILLNGAGDYHSAYRAGFLSSGITLPIVASELGQPISPGAGNVLASVFNGTSHTLYIDNVACTPVTFGGGVLGSPGTFSIGGRQAGTDTWNAAIPEGFVVKRVATSDDRAKAYAWLTRHWNSVLVCEGDSLVHAGPGVGGNNGYIYQHLALAAPTRFLNNIAISGTSLSAASNSGGAFRAAAYADIRIPTNKYGKQYVFYAAWTNNLIPGGGSDAPSVAQAVANMVEYLAGRKAAGYAKVGTATVLSRTDAQANDPGRNAYNATIMAPGWKEANGIDFIADFAADAIMGVNAAPTVNPTFFADGVHPSATGNARLAPIFAAAVNSLPDPSQVSITGTSTLKFLADYGMTR